MFTYVHNYFTKSFDQGGSTEFWIMEKEISQSNNITQ